MNFNSFPSFSGCVLPRIFYGRAVKPLQISVLLAVVLLPLLCLTGCATAEEDTDSVADTAIKGLSGQGTLTTEKPVKDAFGSEYR